MGQVLERAHRIEKLQRENEQLRLRLKNVWCGGAKFDV